jgi:hypothetical protein
MKRCPDLKGKGRPGDYGCGTRGGKCTRKNDKTITCPIRDRSDAKAGSRARR